PIGHAADVDQHGRHGQPQLHDRQQRGAAGQPLGRVPALPEQLDGLVDRRGPLVVERSRGHGAPSPSPAEPDRGCWAASHARPGVAGMAMSVMPNGESASTMALTTAGAAPMVPASPMPLTPSGFVGLGVTVWSSLNGGSSAALGTP